MRPGGSTEFRIQPGIYSGPTALFRGCTSARGRAALEEAAARHRSGPPPPPPRSAAVDGGRWAVGGPGVLCPPPDTPRSGSGAEGAACSDLNAEPSVFRAGRGAATGWRNVVGRRITGSQDKVTQVWGPGQKKWDSVKRRMVPQGAGSQSGVRQQETRDRDRVKLQGPQGSREEHERQLRKLGYQTVRTSWHADAGQFTYCTNAHLCHTDTTSTHMTHTSMHDA